MSDVVYHFTNTVRLPWILHAQELRTAGNRVGGYPEPSFLWATTDERGSRTSAAAMNGQTAAAKEAYRRGMIRLVRITLKRSDFEPWREIIKRFPAWTPHHVERLERTGKGDDPRQWLCRADPLGGSRWIEIETKGWTDSAWRPLRRDVRLFVCGELVAAEIDGHVYGSQRNETAPGQAVSYTVIPHELWKDIVRLADQRISEAAAE